MALVGSDSSAVILSGEYVSSLNVSNRRRYLEKISGIVDTPKAQRSREALPPVTSTDIFGYLVLDKSFCTKERFKAFKSLDLYIYFESGFVNVLGAKKFDTRVVIVGKVLSLLLYIAILHTL